MSRERGGSFGSCSASGSGGQMIYLREGLAWGKWGTRGWQENTVI